MHLSYLHCESKVTDFKLPINSTLQWKTVPSFYSCPITFNDSPLLSSHLYSCVCKPGYEGDGMTCSKVDPCASLYPGGCNINVSLGFSHRA